MKKSISIRILGGFLLGFLRWLRIISAKWWGQLFLIGLPIMIILFSILFGSNIFFDGDLILYEYPIFIWYQDSLDSGQSIFWNSQNLSGFPTFASASGGYLSPIYFLFFKFLNVFTAYHWLIFLNLILAGFFTCRLLRGLGLSGLPAVIGGLVYVFSQWLIVSQLIVVNSFLFLPLLFLLLLKIYKKDIWWPVITGILAIGLLLITSHYNWSAIILFGTGLFVLFLCWQKRNDLTKAIKLLFKYFLMVFGGISLSIFQMGPALTYLKLSSRSAGLTYQEATAGIAKLADLFTFISPNFNIPLFSGSGQFYFGILPLFLLLFAFALKNPFCRFFSYLFICSLILAMEYSPLYWLLQKLPGFQYLRAPSRWLFLGFFCASLAVGFGAQYFLNSGFEKWKSFLFKFFKYLLIIFTGSSLLIYSIMTVYGNKILSLLKLYFNEHIYPRTSGLPLEHYHQVIDSLFLDAKKLFNFFDLAFLLPWLFFIGSFLLIVYFYRQKKNQEYFLPSVLILVILNFSLVFCGYFDFLPIKALNYQPNISRFISTDNERIFSFLPGFTEYQKLTVPYDPDPEQIFIFQSEILAPNINLFYGLDSIDGYDNLMHKEYSEIIALIGSDRAMVGEKLSNLDISLEDKIKLFQKRQNLLDMLGVKYVISAYDLENERLEKVFTSKVTKYEIPIYIYENKDFLPLVYLANEIEYLNPASEKNLGIITDNKNNFNKVTFVECLDCQNVQSQGGEIKVEDYENGYFELTVQNLSDSWLVFNENNLPGWRAIINGQETKIYSANHLFQAILVPAGENKIIFKYHYFDILFSFLN